MTGPRHEGPPAPSPNQGGGAKRRQRVYLLIGGALIVVGFAFSLLKKPAGKRE